MTPHSVPNAEASPTRTRRGLLVAVSLLTILTLAVAVAGWRARCPDTFAAGVEQSVRAGVPLGTDRTTAETWVWQTYQVRPAYCPPGGDDRSRGPTLLGRAGVPEAVPGGVVWFPARRPGLAAEVLNRLRPDHVWVFLLLDRGGRVDGYRVFSFGELREAERAGR
jgi:hypothetical protein